MIIIRDINKIGKKALNACVTIGNFDGVHLGHRQLFDAVKNCASLRNGTSVAVTFDPHPLQVLRPGGIKLISTIEQKIELIEQAGMDVLVIIPFDKVFAATTAEEFVSDVLVNRLGVKDLFVGYDYAFGKGRVGNIDFLRRQGDLLGFTVSVIAPYIQNDVVVSSTMVRQLVADGKMRETADLLGRYYQIRGTVQYGKQRGGREIGFPTANLHISEEDLVPKKGVYVCQVICDGACYGGVINIGYNPTFGEGVLVAEAHIFEFDKNIYGKSIKVNLLQFLREEEKFNDIKVLTARIAEDVENAKSVLGQIPEERKKFLW